MAHIKSSGVLHCHLGGGHSFTITPEMGTVKHFPTEVCENLVAKGAEWVKPPRKASAEAVEADPAN